MSRASGSSSAFIVLRSACVAVLVLTAAACDRSSPPTAPTPQPTPQAPTVNVRFEGRVLDFDSDGGIAGAEVEVVGFSTSCSPPCNRLYLFEPRVKARTDAAGRFVVTVPMTANWTSVDFQAAADGYERSAVPLMGHVTAPSVSAAISMYPTITVNPGQSIVTEVGRLHGCFDPSFPCRRYLIPASAHAPVDVEVTSLGGQNEGGLYPAGESFEVTPTPVLKQRLTVTGTGVYIVGEGTYRLTAHR